MSALCERWSCSIRIVHGLHCLKNQQCSVQYDCLRPFELVPFNVIRVSLNVHRIFNTATCVHKDWIRRPTLLTYLSAVTMLHSSPFKLYGNLMSCQNWLSWLSESGTVMINKTKLYLIMVRKRVKGCSINTFCQTPLFTVDGVYVNNVSVSCGLRLLIFIACGIKIGSLRWPLKSILEWSYRWSPRLQNFGIT